MGPIRACVSVCRGSFSGWDLRGRDKEIARMLTRLPEGLGVDVHIVTLTEGRKECNKARQYSASNWFRMDGRPINLPAWRVKQEWLLQVGSGHQSGGRYVNRLLQV